MSRSQEDPFVYLPLTIPGLLVGLGLILGCGYLALDRTDSGPPAPSARHAVIEGTIEWAGWRRSATPDGPTWFLQIRLAEDPRGFLVSAAGLSDPARTRLGEAGPKRNQGRLPMLEGKSATVVVDSHFQEPPRPTPPYMQALWVSGTPLVSAKSADGSPEPGGPSTLVLALLGAGVLLGLGLTSASLHHLAVCVRHGRPS